MPSIRVASTRNGPPAIALNGGGSWVNGPDNGKHRHQVVWTTWEIQPGAIVGIWLS